MSKINPKAAFLIEEYIHNLPEFSKNICLELVNIIHSTDASIIEDWKWNVPVFQKNGMICGFAAFKKHVSLTFFNGAVMSDKHQLFTDNCTAQKTRTIKFYTIKEIQKNKLLDYFHEALSLSNTVAKKSPEKKEILVPDLLHKALENNELAKLNFENMSYTYRKEYAIYIAEAKRETTQLRRLEKVISNLENNVKLHEQYKC
jgi:hypothetical protein